MNITSYELGVYIANIKRAKVKVKLILLAMLIGVLTGVIVVLYTNSLDQIVKIRNLYFSHITLKTVLVFILAGFIMQFLLDKFPLINGSGIPQVAGLMQKKINFRWFPELISKFVTGVLAIFVGLSLGREGPSIHLGSLISDGISKIFKQKEVAEKYLITAGASAGLAAAFNAPLSGVIFAIEELHKYISPLMIVCTLVASMTSSLVQKLMVGDKLTFSEFRHVATINLDFKTFLFNIFLIFVLCQIVLIVGAIFSNFLILFRKKYLNLQINRYIKILLVIFISVIFLQMLPEVNGGGHFLIEYIFYQEQTIKLLFILLIFKLLFTTISYSTGVSGGIFLPMLVTGAIVGKLYGSILVTYFGLPSYYILQYMLIAMTAYFTIVVRAPITGIIIILEMTGNFSNMFLLLITAAFSYILSEIFKLEPIYERLFDLMFHKKIEDKTGSSRLVTYKFVVTDESSFNGKRIKDIKLPKNLLIIGIQRKNEDIIPHGETIIEPSDIIVIYTNEYIAKNAISHILEQSKT